MLWPSFKLFYATNVTQIAKNIDITYKETHGSLSRATIRKQDKIAPVKGKVLSICLSFVKQRNCPTPFFGKIKNTSKWFHALKLLSKLMRVPNKNESPKNCTYLTGLTDCVLSCVMFQVVSVVLKRYRYPVLFATLGPGFLMFLQTSPTRRAEDGTDARQKKGIDSDCINSSLYLFRSLGSNVS